MDYDVVPLLSRRLGLPIVMLVAGAILLTGAPGSAADAAPATSGATQSTSGTAHPVIVDDAPATRSSARSSGVRKWTQSRLYYYETIPAKWDWSLSKAVSKWNASGGRIKLVRTTSRSKAKVRISYGNTGAAAGKATVGSGPGAFVRLSSKYAAVDSNNAWSRIAVMAIFTHELGHVLGIRAHHGAVLADARRAGHQRLSPARDQPGRVPQVPHHRHGARAPLRQDVRRPRPLSELHLVPDRPAALRPDRRRASTGAWTRRSRFAGPGPPRCPPGRRSRSGCGPAMRARRRRRGPTRSWSHRPPWSGRTTKLGRPTHTASRPDWSTLRRRSRCGRRPDGALDAALRRGGRRSTVGDGGPDPGTAYRCLDRCGRIVGVQHHDIIID